MIMLISFCLASLRPIILTVAKCWDPSPQGYFTLPRSEFLLRFTARLLLHRVSNPLLFSLPVRTDEPIRPIDPAAWVSHSVAMTGAYPPYPGSSSLSTITSSSSVTETERESFLFPYPSYSLCAVTDLSSSLSSLFHIHTISS